jgi:putative transcription factor
MQCDMCGKDVSDYELTNAIIEGTKLRVCDKCSKFGKVLKSPLNSFNRNNDKTPQFKQIKTEPEYEEMIVENYSEIIKSAREKKNIKQEDFANLINEKESLIHKIETGHMEPNIKMARKIEKFLGITLIKEVELGGSINISKDKKFTSLTIGDIIKFK